MIDKKNISVIGGDLRIVKLIEILAKDNYNIYTYGLELAEEINEINNVTKFDSLEEAINKSEIIIGPVPLSSNKQDVNMLFSDKKLTVEELISLLKDGKVFIAGNLYENVYRLIENKNIKVIDILKREELAVLNAISTAEGTIEIAIKETISTIHGSKILVMGFGRVGKILSKMLKGIGSDVYCEARKYADLAWIKAYGYHPVYLRDLDQNLGKFDIIINTIPHLILNDRRLNLVKKDCLIIDIASNPGGVDRNAAKSKNIKVIWALSLPGKVAPVTSAEYIKETIYNIFPELDNKV